MSSAFAALLAVHLAATAAMAGLTWFVQVVHYPLFHKVGVDEFGSYERRHLRTTPRVVLPVMTVETVATLAIGVVGLDELGVALPVVGVVLLAVVWWNTMRVQVPMHRELAGGYDATVVDRLVRSNWVRTVGWSARTVVAVAMIVVAA